MIEFFEKYNQLRTEPCKMFLAYVRGSLAYNVKIEGSTIQVGWTVNSWDYWKDIMSKGQLFKYPYRNGELWISKYELL